MTEQEFRNKYVGKAVHCDTEEKAKELLKSAHDFGWKWRGGESLIEEKYWWVSEEETCYVFYLDKTTIAETCGICKLTGYEIVDFESEKKKVKKTKKVFDLGLFVDEMKSQKRSDETIIDSIKVWALGCHGLTEEEISKNYIVLDKWLKEVEVEVELTGHEIAVLEALKVLGFEWIARDENDILYAYGSKPIKRSIEYGAVGNWCHLNKDLFNFITFEDEEPTNIDELLCGLQ